MDLFTTKQSYIKYKWDAMHEDIEGFDLIRFINDNTAIRVAATYTKNKEMITIKDSYRVRTIELIDRRIGSPAWLDILMDNIEKYNFKQIDNKEADDIIRQASVCFLNVL